MSRKGIRARPLAVALAVTWSATFAVAMAAIDTRATYGARVSADEPQYLLSALSLAEDLDLDVSDEISEQRFRDFHEVRLDPQTIALNESGQELSPHDPLLPVLLAVPMGLGGWPAARMALAVLGATTAAVTLWATVRRLGVTVNVATVVVIGLFCSPPLTSYANQIYPEMPAALAVIVAVALLGSEPSLLRRTGVAVAVVALPWLSVKYVPIAAVLGAALVVGVLRAGRRRALLPALWWTLGLAAAAGLYLLIHQRVYGGWTVYAAGDHFVGGEFEVVGRSPNYLGRSRRLVGLLVDRTFGLAAWTPAYLFTLPALVSLARRRRPGWLLSVALVAVGWGVATWVALTMHGWWWPGRQLVVVLPLVVMAVADLVDGYRRLLPAFVAAAAVGVVNWLWLVVEASTGRRTIIVDFMATSNPLYRGWSVVLPDHLVLDAGDEALTALWVVLLAGASWWAWVRAGDHPRSGPGPVPAPLLAQTVVE